MFNDQNISRVPRAEGRMFVNFRNGTNQDIIDTIHKNLPRAIAQTKDIARDFRGSSVYETAYNIHRHLMGYKYKNDGRFHQKIRLPSDFFHNRVGDCKSFSLLGAALLHNLGIPFHFRYASYDPSDKVPSHVYIVAFDGTRPVIIDPVWEKFGGSFNSEKKAKFIKDYNMRISTISGYGSMGCINCPPVSGVSTMIGGNDIGKLNLGAGLKKLQTAVKNTAVVKKASQLQSGVKNTAVVKTAAKAQTNIKQLPGKAQTALKNTAVVKTAAKAQTALKQVDGKQLLAKGKTAVLVAPRSAFLSLVALNVRNFAVSLARADQGALKAKWNQLGGNFTQLQKAIETGKTKKRILGTMIGGPQTIIGEPVAITLLVSAAAIITALRAFLGKDADAPASQGDFDAGQNSGSGSGADTTVSNESGSGSSAGDFVDAIKNIFTGGSSGATQQAPAESQGGDIMTAPAEPGFFSRPSTWIGAAIALVAAKKLKLI